MQYPSDWTVSYSGLADYSDIVGFYAASVNLSDLLPAGITLSIKHYSQEITMDELNNFVNSSLNRPGVQIIESNPATLSGGPAHKLVYSAMTPNGLFRIDAMLVWTVQGNK